MISGEFYEIGGLNSFCNYAVGFNDHLHLDFYWPPPTGYTKDRVVLPQCHKRPGAATVFWRTRPPAVNTQRIILVRGMSQDIFDPNLVLSAVCEIVFIGGRHEVILPSCTCETILPFNLPRFFSLSYEMAKTVLKWKNQEKKVVEFKK